MSIKLSAQTDSLGQSATSGVNSGNNSVRLHQDYNKVNTDYSVNAIDDIKGQVAAQ